MVLDLRREVAKALDGTDATQMSLRKVRRAIESNNGLEAGSLDDRKTQVKALVHQYLAEQDAAEEADGDGDGDGDIPAQQPKKKRRVKKEEAEEGAEAAYAAETEAPAAAAEVAKPRKSTLVTKSGAVAPTKGLKQAQAGACSIADFIDKAVDMEVNIFGNRLIGPPRDFSSGNRGWYAGGKIEVEVNGKTLWAQVGINCTIVGSKEWE